MLLVLVASENIQLYIIWGGFFYILLIKEFGLFNTFSGACAPNFALQLGLQYQ